MPLRSLTFLLVVLCALSSVSAQKVVPPPRIVPSALPKGVLPVGRDGKPLNLDFETGDLRDWVAEGDAFTGQPIKGDTVVKRRGDMKSEHQGNYWIGSYERNGDKPQGTLTSAPFKVTHPWAAFLVGGGPHETTCVELVRRDSGKVFLRASGQERENMQRVVVDLKDHQGKEIFIRLVDRHSGHWGHVNFDDFRFYDRKPNFPNTAGPVRPADLFPHAGLPPDKAAEVMTVPDGFKVTAFAGEPDIRQPIAMTIDDRGRLWVAEAYSYPLKQPKEKARDRILIFEDTDGDGKFDKRTVFCEGLNLVSGLEIGFGGVWVGQAPELLFIPIKEGEDKPAGPPQVVLDGWGYQDTHETLNSFIWGPDGWLYGCHGVFTHSLVGKPGTPKEQRVPINAGIWRYHPIKKKFEVFAYGTSNPWGVDFNDHGHAFLTCCVIPHLFHVFQGGRFQRQAGPHFQPHTYADIETIARHRHWIGNQWNEADRARSDASGGGHAHAGAMIYLGDAWAEDGIVIVSRHLIARQERMPGVLAARPWDTVLVDEAHAARRRVFAQEEPNLLLQLLQEMKARRLFRSLWLLTATPMQLAAHEVHDLLMLAGVDEPRWGLWINLNEFEQFFERLRAFAFAKEGRAKVIAMTRRAVELGAPDLSAAEVPANWSELQWRSLVQRIQNGGPGLDLSLQGLLPQQAEGMTPYLARQTPLAVYVFRHTRETMRIYRDRGLLRAGLADRQPEDVPVAFQSSDEEKLYGRIDELCGKFYRLAELPEQERSGVGFLMAVFRKRLASSFAAFRLSLERRRDLIAAIQRDLATLDEAELFRQTVTEGEEEEDDIDVPASLERERQRLLRLRADPDRRGKLEAEWLYLQDYITQLGRIDDSKFREFAGRLEDLLGRWHRVIVFTQYLDTLDFIRDKLIARYGNRMACYSGRGGEVWDAQENAWKLVEKSEVKARCKRSHALAIDVLLGTDAASEGLNLQEFSALFNYDLPWNPMRVEQRIGRIDRIGQEAKFVLVSNLYLTGTIEEDVYGTLKDRIGVFENVVGPLQPILAEMPRIFRKLAQGEIERAEALRQLEAARQRKAPAVADAIGRLPDDMLGDMNDTGAEPVASQTDLARWCLMHPAPGMQIRNVPEPGTSTLADDGTQGCLGITWPYAPPHLGIRGTEEILATFNGELADRHPPTGPTQDMHGIEQPGHEGVRLLTWGDPYLTAWLEAVRGDPLTEEDCGAAGFNCESNPLR